MGSSKADIPIVYGNNVNKTDLFLLPIALNRCVLFWFALYCMRLLNSHTDTGRLHVRLI